MARCFQFPTAMNDPQEQPTPCLALVPVDPPAKPLNAGRPTVMTPEIIAKLEYIFALGGTDKEACLYADIGLETLYNYQRNHPEFAERKALLKETPRAPSAKNHRREAWQSGQRPVVPYPQADRGMDGENEKGGRLSINGE